MDCRNSIWSLQPTHLNGTEKDTQETSQNLQAGRVGWALPQQERSEIASFLFKTSELEPKELGSNAQHIEHSRGWQLFFLNSEKPLPMITMVILQTQSNLGADNTANQAVTEPHKACRLRGEWCTVKKHQS